MNSAIPINKKKTVFLEWSQEKPSSSAQGKGGREKKKKIGAFSRLKISKEKRRKLVLFRTKDSQHSCLTHTP